MGVSLTRRSVRKWTAISGAALVFVGVWLFGISPTIFAAVAIFGALLLVVQIPFAARSFLRRKRPPDSN